MFKIVTTFNSLLYCASAPWEEILASSNPSNFIYHRKLNSNDISSVVQSLEQKYIDWKWRFQLQKTNVSQWKKYSQQFKRYPIPFQLWNEVVLLYFKALSFLDTYFSDPQQIFSRTVSRIDCLCNRHSMRHWLTFFHLSSLWVRMRHSRGQFRVFILY